MTETDWLTRTNPKQLLEFLGTRSDVSKRKLLLFAAACCRRIWLLLEARSRQAIESLERGLDGDDGELKTAARLAEEAFRAPEPGWGKFAPWEALRKGRAHVRAQ